MLLPEVMLQGSEQMEKIGEHARTPQPGVYQFRLVFAIAVGRLEDKKPVSEKLTSRDLAIKSV